MLKFPDLDQTKGITWIQSDPFDMRGTTTTTCLVEHEVKYLGNDINNARGLPTPDWQHCKSLCMDEHPTAQYFTYMYRESINKCWCKTSDAGRSAAYGVISGEVACVGQGEIKNTVDTVKPIWLTFLAPNLSKKDKIAIFWFLYS